MSDRFPQLQPKFQPMVFIAAAFALGILAGRHLKMTSTVLAVASAFVWLISLLDNLRRFRGFSLTAKAQRTSSQKQEARSKRPISCILHPASCVSTPGVTAVNSETDSQAAEKRALGSIFVPLVLLGFCLAGALHFQVEKRSIRADRLRRLYEQNVIVPGEPVELVGKLAGPPEEAPSRVYLDLQAEEIRTFNQTHRASGKARLMMVLADEEARESYEQLRRSGLDYGARVRVSATLNRAQRYRNPGSPDYGEYLERRGYDLSGVVKNPLLIEVLAYGQGNRLLTILYDMKQLTERRIDQLFSQPTSGILKALLLGNRNFLDRPTAEKFRAGGTFHILVISGFHIAFIAGVIVWLISQYTRSWWLRSLPTIIVVWLYALIVGLQPPITRAAVVMTAVLLAPLLFRQALAANSIGLAGFILLVIDPNELFSPSFQLTFLAVASLVLIAMPLVSRLRAIGEWQPSVESPHPPFCPQPVRWLAETLYWDERKFQREQKKSPIRFKLDKADFAKTVSRVPGVQRLLRYLALSLVVSFVVQIAMVPIMAEYFHRVVLIGILLNVLISVLVTLLGFSSITAIAFSVLGLNSVAHWFSLLSQRLTAGMLSSFDFPLGFRLASFRVPDYSGAAVLVYVCFFVSLLYFAYRLNRWQPMAQPKNVIGRWSLVVGKGVSRTTHDQRLTTLLRFGWLAVVVFLACLVMIVAHPIGHAYDKGSLAVHFLDVGHGDCALVEFPDGTTMLVDAGGESGRIVKGPLSLVHGQSSKIDRQRTTDDGQMTTDNEQGTTDKQGEPEFAEDTLTIGEAVVSNFLWSRGIKRINYLVPTHADADHIEGFFQVIKNFEVGRAILARLPTQDALFNELLKELELANVPIQIVEMGDRFQVGGANITVLWPPHTDIQPPVWDNSDSLALRLTYGDYSILLGADIEQAAERALVASGFDLRSYVLKAAHHGGRTSSTEAFITRVQPQWAIISAPESASGERFRHPHPEVVERYNRFGARIFQTGTSGTITVTTDGRTITIRTFSR